MQNNLLPTNRNVSCKICSAEKSIVNQKYLTDCSQIALLELDDPLSYHLLLLCGTNHHRNKHYPRAWIYMPRMTREHFFCHSLLLWYMHWFLQKFLFLVRRAKCKEGSLEIQNVKILKMIASCKWKRSYSVYLVKCPIVEPCQGTEKKYLSNKTSSKPNRQLF